MDRDRLDLHLHQSIKYVFGGGVFFVKVDLTIPVQVALMKA